MLIVENDPAVVEADLAAGAVVCPACQPDKWHGEWNYTLKRASPKHK